MNNRERLKLLIENHNKHISSIMLNFANQMHDILSEIEKEENKDV